MSLSSTGKTTGTAVAVAAAVGKPTEQSKATQPQQPQYRPMATQRTVVVQRSGAGGGPQQRGGGAGGVGVGVSAAAAAASAYTMPGSQAQVAQSGVGTIRTNRAREKQDLRDLNERFATYIEKVRFLEAQNKKLTTELQSLKDKWGKETENIKAMYETELKQLRHLITESEKRKAELEVQRSAMEDQICELEITREEKARQNNIDREIIDKLNQQLADYEGEIALLRRRVNSFDTERAKDKKEMTRLKEDIARLRTDLDQETLSHINAENEAQSLREELEFIKQVHDSELKELAALAYRDTTKENREYWKNEMAQALRDIQAEYDTKVDEMKVEMETFFNIKVQESKTTNTKGQMELTHAKEEIVRIKKQLADYRSRMPELEAKNTSFEKELEELRHTLEENEREHLLEKNQLVKDIADCRAELESVLQELQHLLDAKLSLELEIAAYRKLLECEEFRLKEHGHKTREVLHSQIETSEKSEKSKSVVAAKEQVNAILKGEMSAKTTFQRTAKGTVNIQDCSADGVFIAIENTGKQREDISKWKLVRNVDGGRHMVNYVFPDRTFLEYEGSRRIIKVYTKGKKPASGPPHDLECSEQSWGFGQVITTVLQNKEADERATYTQNTKYTV